VLPKHRELLADGRPVKLGGRAFDVLMARVWPGRIIAENSLAAQIAALTRRLRGGARADPHDLRARLSVRLGVRSRETRTRPHGKNPKSPPAPKPKERPASKGRVHKGKTGR